MAFHGILYQTSCASKPQQNVLGECKNRHLIETICTILIYGEIPQ